MDPRLKHIAENFDTMKIGVDEPFKFRCTQCGKCCINRDDILLSPYDVFRVAKELGLTPKAFVEEYCETYLGQTSKMPIVRLMPRGEIKRCPLLKDKKCSVHKVKPTVCAMFPIGRTIRIDKDEYGSKAISVEQIQYIFTSPNCGDDQATHTVREWFAEFGIPVRDEYFIKWHETIAQISPYIGKAIKVLPEIVVNPLITLIYVKMYLDYDLTKDFYPQFVANADIVTDLIRNTPLD